MNFAQEVALYMASPVQYGYSNLTTNQQPKQITLLSNTQQLTAQPAAATVNPAQPKNPPINNKLTKQFTTWANKGVCIAESQGCG